MAFFGSKSIERELKRSYSTDRLRRDSERGCATRSNSVSHALASGRASRAHKHLPQVDEFGVKASHGHNQNDVPSLSFSSTTASGSLPPDPASPPDTGSLSTPLKASGRPSSSNSLHKEHSPRLRTLSATGSKHSSNSSHPPRKRAPQPDGDGAMSDGTRTRANSGASGSKRGEGVERKHSSDLKPDQEASKQRSKTSLRAQAVDYGAPAGAQRVSSSPSSSRAPKGPRPPDSQKKTSRRPPSPNLNCPTASAPTAYSNTFNSNSSSSSSAFAPPSKGNASPRQWSAQFSPAELTKTSTSRRDDSSLAIPQDSHSNPNSFSKKSYSGNISDGSYGSPFSSEFGMGFSVKSLLSRPADSTVGTGVRSEPDTNADSYDSYGASGLAARRRRIEGRGHLTEPPSSVHSLSGASLSLLEPPRRPTTSDPEAPRSVLGSLGRARGLEWGHVLSREKDREHERGKTHAREGSSFSLSSPSEGVVGYPYGRVLEREQERRMSKNMRPIIQLTTAAVKRLSALGAREADRMGERERSHSPVTPMTFAAPSPVSGRPSQTSSHSPLTATSSRSRPARSVQPSPSPNSAVMQRTESPLPPVGLTPAESVAHAYKEQLRRRAELEREAAHETEVPEKMDVNADSKDCERDNAQRTIRVKEKAKDRSRPLSRSASASAAVLTSTSTSAAGKKGDLSLKDELAGPYYTVFGETSGRIVAIGSERDSAFGLFDRAHERRAKATEQAVVAELALKTTATTVVGTGSSSTLPGISETGVAGTTTVEERPERSRTLRRKLSRKMSGKFKREESLSRGGGRDSGKDSSDGTERKGEFGEVLSGGEEWFNGTEGGHVRTRPSLTLNTTAPGRRSVTLPREKNAPFQPVKMSMDSFVAVQRTESISGRTIPSAANGAVTSPKAFIPAWGRDGGDMAAQGRMKEEKVREKEKDKGKLWGLVKRISSTTLKDKYRRSSAEVVPPVPALPRDVLLASPPRTCEVDSPSGSERGTEKEACGFKAGLRPLLAHNHQRPSTAPALNMGEPVKEGRFAMLRKKPSQSFSQTLPSLGTGSSSPISSEPAISPKQPEAPSTGWYSDPNASARFTSKPVLGEHILPPETLHMFDDLYLSFDERKEDDAKSNGESRYTMSTITTGYDSLFYGEEPASHQALPVPPRRGSHAKVGGDEDGSSSPTIPSFSADNPINAFGHRNRKDSNATTEREEPAVFSGVDFGPRKPSPSTSPESSLKAATTEPPPRPPRSARRGPLAPSIIQSTHSTSRSDSPSSSVARTVIDDHTGRASLGARSQASTARPNMHRGSSSPCSSPSPPPELLDSQSPVSASDSASSTMTFRDMNGMALKPMWTEKEKLDKWNDLLDRSEKAGGTLHVGVEGLLSDQMRDSAFEPIRDSLYEDF